MSKEVISYTTNENNLINKEVVKNIVAIEKELKTIQDKEKELKKVLLEGMKKRGLKKIDTPELTLTYIEPSDRGKFNANKLREDNPDLYDEYITISKVKESIRIKIK